MTIKRLVPQDIVKDSPAQTDLPSYLVEFDLDSILEYAHILSLLQNSNGNNTTKNAPLLLEDLVPENFKIIQRHWVSQMKSPLPLKSRAISQYLGSGVSRESSDCFRIMIQDFEFKPASAGQPLVVILKKQKGQIKRGQLLSMHVSDPEIQAEILSEIQFIASRLKKCKSHFHVSQMHLGIDLFPRSNNITITISYKLEIVTLFYRYFSSDISQALSKIIEPQMKLIVLEDQSVDANFESLPKDTHLFYNAITDKTSRMSSVSQSFDHPALQVQLLSFQRKSVQWLLSKEHVVYDQHTHNCSTLPIVSADLYRELKAFPLGDSLSQTKQIYQAFSKLCFGWKCISYHGEVCWYNNYTGNIMLNIQAVQFLRSYFIDDNQIMLQGCGLLSEEMGLGKTVEITTLIQLNSRPRHEIGEPISLQFKDGGDYRVVKKARTTLIAVPESIIRQWYTEICQICPSLLVTIYKGLGKYPELNNIPQYIAEFLQSYDVVLLNYSTLSRETDYANYSSRHKQTRGGKKRNSEGVEKDIENGNQTERTKSPVIPEVDSFKAEFHIPEYSNQNEIALSQKKFERTVMTELARKIAMRDPRSIPHTQYYESPLMSCQWWRVVLDEVQMVSSGSTRAFATASILPRFHSWGVSGTPSTLPAVLQFLRVSPFNYDIQKHCWKLLTSTDTGNEDFVEVWLSLSIRHTKNMVYDDIKLPPQRRVLLTIPFTEVEQDKYKEVLESTLGYIGVYDIKEVIEKRLNFDGSSYSHLRSRLLRLRQLCGNLQVGKLPKHHTIKGKNKTKILISGVQELKTLGSVLIEMIEAVEDEVSEGERLVVNRILEICLALEYVLYPEKVIEVLNVLLIEIKDLMKKASQKNDIEKEKFKELRSFLIKKEALSHENIGDISDHEYELEAGAPTTETSLTVSTSTVKVEVEDTVGEDDQVWEKLMQFQKLKDRLVAQQARFRSWKMVQHKCYFLLASAHFQLYDPEYQTKISNLKVKFNAVDKVLDTIKKSGFLQNDFKSNNMIKEDAKNRDDIVQSITPQVDVNDEDEKNRILEKELYSLAEECRRDILRHSITDVQSVTEKRIRNRGVITVDDWINDGRKSFPKSTKKLFKIMPRIEISHLEHLISNIKYKKLVDLFQRMAIQLNAQTDLINNYMDQLFTVLTNPLNNNEKDADGEEFNQSVQDQEQASCLMLVISQMLMDRSNAVFESTAAVTEIERQQENEFKQEAQRVSDRRFLKELQGSRISVKPDAKVSMEEYIEDGRLLDLEQKSSKSMAGLTSAQDVTFILRTVFENERTSQSLLKKELNSNFNMVFNSRVEYFRQLQQISDSVQNDSFNFSQEQADREGLEILFQNLFRNLEMAQNRLSKSITRARYLATLVPGTKGEIRDDEREDVICIICQSSITVGSLTFCGHKFCKDCLEEWLKRSPNCPMCKTPTDRNTVYGFTQVQSSLKALNLDISRDQTQEPESQVKGQVHQIYKEVDNETLQKVQKMNLLNSYGSKVDLIVKQVLYLRNQNPEVQIVIFSQWQDLLVILAFAFDEMNISYVSAKDSRVPNSRKKHRDPVEEFKDQSNIKTCFLLNAQAQSSGLTLINATHIFLCEPLINTSTELQAISRIHRIGQKKLTNVWMFAIENSVEENIVALGTSRRVEYFRANAKEINNASVSTTAVENGTELGANELRAAESFALTLGPSTNKKVADSTEFVDDDDLYKIYFGVNSE